MSCLIIIHCLREITNRHISRIFSIILTKWLLSYFPLLLFMPIFVKRQASVPQFFRQCVAHINKICYFCSRNSKGEVLEWLKRHAWKACIRLKRIGGSNPPLSANKGVNQQVMRFTPFITPKIFIALKNLSYFFYCNIRLYS